MTELTTKDSLVRVFVIEKDKCILINRPDALIILCFCGGARSTIFHVQASDARLPPLRMCRCDETVELSTEGENMWTTDGKIERMYARLKEGE